MRIEDDFIASEYRFVEPSSSATPDVKVSMSRNDLLIMDSEIKADLYHFSNALDAMFDIVTSIKKSKCEIEK